MQFLKTSLCTAFSLCLLVFSSTSMADHSWGKFKWKPSSIPFNLDLGDNVDSGWDNHLSDASTDWTVSTVLDTNVTGGSTDPVSCAPEAGNVQVCNAPYGTTGWLGIAQIYTRGSTIIAGTAKLNDTYFNDQIYGGFYNTPAWRQMVMCQEVAHTFGLDHQDEATTNANLGTCMDYTDDPLRLSTDGFTNEHPNQHDYDQLMSIYAAGEKTKGGGGCKGKNCNRASAIDIASQIHMKGPAQWGRLKSKHGPQEVYELDFGHGRKVITFVTWTLEHADDHKH